jgi:flagellar hook assembly protein FlgD
VESEATSLPERFALLQNYPNPFNPVTKINFRVPEATQVKLEIYNVRGQRVRTLVDHHLEAGHHFVHWDSRDMNGQSVAAGIYLYRLMAGERTATRKMLLLK